MTDTLAAFYGLDDTERQAAAARTLARSRELSQSRIVPGALRSRAAEAVIWMLKAALNGSVSGVMANAWAKTRELQRAIAAPEGQVSEITLHEHEIALSRRPSIEVELNGAPTGLVLFFEMKLALTLASASIQIANAHIIGAALGGPRGAGSIGIGRATLAERKTAKLDLPTQLSFSPGVPLRG